MNEEELNRKMVEFAGFKRTNDHLPETKWDIYALYSEPDEKLIRRIISWGYVNKGHLNFTESLDACLKYLFPKLLSDNKQWWHFVEFARWEGLPPNRRRLKDGEMIKRLLDPMYICQTIEKITRKS